MSGITHTKVSGKAAASDATLIDGPAWDATHTVPEGVTLPSLIKFGNLYMQTYSEDVLDDGLINLATGVTGTLFIIFGDQAEWSTIQVASNGTVENAGSKDANLHLANDDGFYCVYDGGAGAVISPKVGSTVKVRAVFLYS